MGADKTAVAPSDRWFLWAIVSASTAALVLWLGAVFSAFGSGHAVPPFELVSVVEAVTADAGEPSAAWGSAVGPAWVYWTCTAAIVLALLLVGIAWFTLRSRHRADPGRGVGRLEGLASRAEVARVAGARALLRRAGTLRPCLAKPSVVDLGHRLGRSRGVECYASVEDSMVLLGPPRSGKGLHVVVNAILDAPGAVVTTSTRPDNLTATLTARSRTGPVAVFDPQGLAPGVSSATRWSPIRGCESPQVALIRAKALTSGAARGTTEASFWQSAAEQAVRCLLHAAALGGVNSRDLYRWSLSAPQAREAVRILATHPDAAGAWHQALEAIVSSDPRQRDSIWAMVTIAFAPLADPRVLEAVSPDPGEEFDPAMFLQERGTVYVLGTSAGASATAGLVAAFVEDLAEAARKLAAAAPGGRLDPPLAMILDEAANYPLPSLTSLMSEGGGTGISTLVVLQSLAQARAVWGEHAATAIWDAAIVKLILGGGSNARDLADLSNLIGTRTETQHTDNLSGDGHRSRSTSLHEVPIMDSSRLRMLPFGTGVLLLRAARPILLDLRAWTSRTDATRLREDQQRLETQLNQPHPHQLPRRHDAASPSAGSVGAGSPPRGAARR
jgi:type IV secretory pathway TraG/TraD family ATPase VirD4